MPNDYTGVTIEYGTVGSGVKLFSGSKIRNVKISQFCDLLAAELQINTADFTLEIDADNSFTFEEGYPFTIRLNNDLVLITFAKEVKRQSKNLWDFKTEDYLGKMADTLYLGCVYPNGLDSDVVLDVIEDIYNAAGVPFNVDTSLSPALKTALMGQTLQGAILPCDCRQALQQIAFAYGFCVTTCGKNTVYLFTPSDDPQERISIPLERIRQNAKIETSNTYDTLEIQTHSYTIDDYTHLTRQQVYTITNMDVSRGYAIAVFDSPNAQYNLRKNYGYTLTEYIFYPSIPANPSAPPEQGESRDNTAKTTYAIIKGLTSSTISGGVFLEAFPVVDSKEKYTKTLTQTTRGAGNPTDYAKSTLEIADTATLVNASNASAVLNRVTSILALDKTMTLTIIDRATGSGGNPFFYGGGDIYGTPGLKYGSLTPYFISYEDTPVNVGDYIKAATDKIGQTFDGYVIQTIFDLKSGILEKQIVIQGNLVMTE